MLLNGKLHGQAVATQRNVRVNHVPNPVVHCVVSGRGKLVVRQAVEVPPSMATAASELDSLSRLSSVVPDTQAFETLVPGAKLAAASVSAATLRSVLVGQSLGHKPYENAITAALAAGHSSSPLAATADPLDRAMANVGAMLAECVAGRVETVVDPRLADDEAALVAKVRSLAAAYAALNVPRDRLLFSLPATWAGTKAAQTLEAEGVATMVIMVYSMAQGVAAMQAGASVVRIAVSRIHDWYDKNPGVIRNPHGPREDAGVPSSYDPALELVKDLYCYGRKFHPKTKIMATGLRSREDVLEVAGVDYLVLSGRLMRQLSEVSTDQGYNDGLSAVSGSAGVEAALTSEVAAASDVNKWEPVGEVAWRAGLGLAASQLLEATLAMRRRDMEELVALLGERISGQE